ncbi:GntR family transcriptional regulator [Paludibacterium denitrificans]|uniref:GntR family transcriptional regulator n=1 Tax=Paludibacterium denitrificans TaxID=2675226 RepID=UPI001E481F8C|nr:winged helix-turn-helix domain-containing protein [Paludibacterium denitrificans]
MPASRLAATRPHSLLADLLQLRFAHDSEESDNKQLYRLLREAILLEELVPGCRLPSSRQLAAELGIARNTVIHVYERLTAEGYVAAYVGKGTFVLDTRPDKMVRQRQATADQPEPASKVLPLLSRRGAGLMNQAGAGLRQWGAFMPGVPEMRAFPSRTGCACITATGANRCQN